MSISEWTFLRLEHSIPPASDGASPVSSMPAQGLSQSELIRTSVMYSPGLHHLTPPHSTGPSPSGWSFGPTSVAAQWWRSGTFCSDPVREYLAPIRLLAPHRLEFRLRLYPHLPLAGFRLGFAFPVARPFVCECRTIPAIPCPRTIPGLPESLTLFPTVSPAHTLVRRSGTHAPSSP